MRPLALASRPKWLASQPGAALCSSRSSGRACGNTFPASICSSTAPWRSRKSPRYQARSGSASTSAAAAHAATITAVDPPRVTRSPARSSAGKARRASGGTSASAATSMSGHAAQAGTNRCTLSPHAAIEWTGASAARATTVTISATHSAAAARSEAAATRSGGPGARSCPRLPGAAAPRSDVRPAARGARPGPRSRARGFGVTRS